MNSSKTYLLAVSSLLVVLVGCGGGAASSAPEETTHGESDAATAPTSPAAAAPSSPPDASADAVAPTPGPKPLAKHCTGTLPAPDVCVETAEGRVGDVVAVDIVLLGSTMCTEAGESSGRLALDLSRFELTNEVEMVACRTRRVSPSITPGQPPEILWNAFGGGSLGGCPNNLSLGKVDTLKLRVLPGTPPGDYAIGWRDAGFIGSDAACQQIGGGVAGVVRVLP